MKIKSDQVKFIKEFNSSNGGTRCMIPISEFLELPVEIENPKETSIYKCYDGMKNLLGEIRPKENDKLIDIKF